MKCLRVLQEGNSKTNQNESIYLSTNEEVMRISVIPQNSEFSTMKCFNTVCTFSHTSQANKPLRETAK